MYPDTHKIKLILITGFLGSGKTTFLNHILKKYASRAGVIVNDFGALPVDAALIKNSGVENSRIYELNNGSIFCTCLTGALGLALKFFTGCKPEFLFVEASGLGDPSSIKKILLDFQLLDYFSVQIICLADPDKILKLQGILPAVKRQITCASQVIINKTDLYIEHIIKQAEEFIAEINPEARCLRSEYGRVELQFTPARLPDENLNSCNSETSRPGMMIIKPENTDINELEKLLFKILPYCLRIKGFFSGFYFSDSGGKIIKIRTEDDKPQGIQLIFNPADGIIIKKTLADNKIHEE
ncbi:MAG: hypothetical protein A2096_16650 [Spirochaetes bacterium GWF1_41_5]|nr:MAG: hypothetical protein A2096_16650 [Spirochaetes bacterium GWF1_41_5]HBE01555.1 hypothetical protein [Spirochaetia bacterium]